MHILITVNATWNAWNFRRGLIQRVLNDGHRLTVFSPIDGAVVEILSMGCDHVPLEMSADGLSLREFWGIYKQSYQVFKATRPDIVLGFTVKNNLICGAAARSLDISFLPNVTGLGTAFLSNVLMRELAVIMYKGVFSSLQHVIFQNEDDRELFIKCRIVRDSQAKLIPGSGVDTEHFGLTSYPAVEGECVRFLMISRVMKDKGVMEYVEAARLVRKIVPSARFQILGSLSYKNRTAIEPALVDAWVREGVIEYLGETKDVRPHIESAHCVVLPSYREGAPRTLIEAASMGRPVVATDVPGCRSVMENNVTGLFCRVKDSASLANAMLRFIKLPFKSKIKMGQEGRRKIIQEYDEKIVIRKYIESIEALTSGY